MTCIGFTMIEAFPAMRGDWWRREGMPMKLRKGNSDDMGYMYKEPRDPRWRWMPKAEFELQYDVCP